MICCFTGHRDIQYRELSLLNPLLEKTIRSLASEGVTCFRAGGAIGFDTVAALNVLDLRDRLGLRLELLLPCRDQSRGWSERDKKYYEYILSAADSSRYISEFYTRDCMLERNRRLVDGADVCVAYCLRSRGGTAYTLSYALKSGVRVINLADQIKNAPHFS